MGLERQDVQLADDAWRAVNLGAGRPSLLEADFDRVFAVNAEPEIAAAAMDVDPIVAVIVSAMVMAVM